MAYTYLHSPFRREGSLHGFAGGRSAEEPIGEGQFESVLKVLTGPSPWQPFLIENLRLARKRLPPRPFRVVKLAEFEQVMQGSGHTGNVRNIGGVTNKRTGVITMLEWRVNSGETFLGAALHEAVHLVSHPPGSGTDSVSTANAALGPGLLEGLVECVTIDILNEQRITLARSSMRGHMQRLPVAIALLRGFGVHVLSRVLFGGDSSQLEAFMVHIYSKPGWNAIRAATTDNQPQRAMQMMKLHRERQERERNEQLKKLFRQTPARQP
jgi:hypothetical protein